MYAIEKNVPMPPTYTEGATKYPWRKMNVGDSFVMDKKITSAAAQANDAARRIGNGVKFSVRSVDDHSTRIWRTA